jgi:hypothetical protein
VPQTVIDRIVLFCGTDFMKTQNGETGCNNLGFLSIWQITYKSHIIEEPDRCKTVIQIEEKSFRLSLQMPYGGYEGGCDNHAYIGISEEMCGTEGRNGRQKVKEGCKDENHLSIALLLLLLNLIQISVKFNSKYGYI